MIVTNPHIIQDGLILHVDQWNPKSFPGEPTANMNYSQPGFDGSFETSSGWSFDAKTNGAWDYYTNDFYSGTRCVRIKNSTSAAIAFWPGQLTFTIGTWYTMSVWAKNLNCPTVPFISSVSGPYLDFTGIDSTWKKFSITFQATATTDNIYIRTNSNAVQGYFLIDEWQLEAKAHPTPFTSTSRITTGGLKNLVGGSMDLDYVLFDANAKIYFNHTDGQRINAGQIMATSITTPFTYEAFYKPLSNTAQWETIIGNAGSFAQIGVSSGGAYNIGQDGGGGWWESSGVSKVLNQWVHIVGIYDGANASLWINGVRKVAPVAHVFLVNHGNTLLGSYHASGAEVCNGAIDIARVYNRALSDAEVVQNFNANRNRYGI